MTIRDRTSGNGLWQLGQTSARYESGTAGAATISSGRGDKGGVSYGTYQLSSREGTLQEYLAQSGFGRHFEGLRPATPAFDAKWREVAGAYPGFAQDQHVFVGRSHYREQLRRLEARGLTFGGRGPAVQDCLWSTAVQFRNLTPRIVAGALAEAFGPRRGTDGLSDRQIVEAVQDYKIRHTPALFRSSPELWGGLQKRARSEKAALVALDASRPYDRAAMPAGTTAVDAGPERHRGAQVGGGTHAPALSPHAAWQPGASGPAIGALQRQLDELGYRDAQGHALAIDGDFGPATRHAVHAFQRDHGLAVDGVVGRQTRQALDRAAHSLPTSAMHPQHALYMQVRDGVRWMEGQRGIGSGVHTDRLAAALAVEAMRHGLVRVDRVELSEGGDRARAVQFSAAGNVSGLNRTTPPVSTQWAVQQPLAMSGEQLRHPAPEPNGAAPSPADSLGQPPGPDVNRPARAPTL